VTVPSEPFTTAVRRTSKRQRSATVSLALSGGNALGAYAAGAVEAIEAAGIRPQLISGASIGAITGAIVAGNPPGLASAALREFWSLASSGVGGGWPCLSAGRPREMVNSTHALQTLLLGRPGLFSPRPSGFFSLLPGTPPDVALFDSRPIVKTLERLIDFERLQPDAGGPRLVVCAVDLATGEPVYFDSLRERIKPRHLLASTGFIPSFPPVEIGGRLLGDPGLVCNLPLDPVLLDHEAGDRLCFAVDLFSGAGERPYSLDSSLERTQDIIFSAQTARTLQAFQREQQLRHQLRPAAAQVEVVLAAYRALPHEVGAKTLEYSAASLRERWSAGRRDMAAGIAARSLGRPRIHGPGFTLYGGHGDDQT
jgi:NTE family protein